MTNRISRITKLLSVLNPSTLEIIDESYMHHGHVEVDGMHEETHLKINIKASFADMKLIDKHRKIKELIKAEFDNGLHAVSIRLI
jgi:BolA protein